MRRRPFKPFRRPVQIQQVPIRKNPRLLKAHNLFNRGDYGKAGLIYLDLAKQAELRDLPITPDLFTRVAVCQINLGKYDEAARLLLHVFEWLKMRKRFRKIRILFDNITRKLNITGQEKIIHDLEKWIEENISADIRSSDLWSLKAKESRNIDFLPAHCDSCGAPVSPTELEWFDGSTPVCSYCGCIIEMKQVE